MAKTLVLGGGGLIGIAWETGVLAGLARAGSDPSAADLIVGTSAGSVVGAQLALGRDLEGLLTAQVEGTATVVQGREPDLPALGQIFGMWGGAETMTTEIAAQIGALALSARTIPEEEFIAALAQYLQVETWPERLVTTAVDCETGIFQPWDAASSAPLSRGVASSCAVPGLFPPITVNGRRYMDGGVRSGTSADLALRAGVGPVLVIAPIAAGQATIGAIAQRQIDAEVAAVRAAGCPVIVVVPEAAELEAFGPDLMNPDRRQQAAEAGLARGARIAEQVRAEWT